MCRAVNDGQERTGARRGVALLLVAVAVWLVGVWPLPRSEYLGCEPSPDAPEYLAGAVALVEHGEHSIAIAGQRLPSRYPIGFSAAIAPSLVFGAAPIRAPFVTSALAGLALLLMVFAFVRSWCGPLAAGLAALLLATTPAFVVLARAPMSEMASTVVTTAGVGLCVAYVRRCDARLGAAGAFLLGLATVFRLANVLFAPAVLAAFLAVRGRLVRPLRDGAVLAVALGAGCLPVLASQWGAHGSPFATGYAFWVPDRAIFTNSFGVANLVENLRYLAREVAQVEWKTTVATYYGTGSYFGPVSLVLFALGVGRALRSPTARWLALGVAAYPAAMLLYYFHDARFFFAVVPLAAALVAWQSVEVSRGAGSRLRAPLLLLLALHCLGVPGSGAVADVPALLLAPAAPPALRHELIADLAARPPGLVLSTFNPPYGRALLGAAWTVSPALDEHDYRWSKVFSFGAKERASQLATFLEAGAPVYLVAEDGFPAVLDEVVVPGRRWEVLATLRGGGVAHLR